VRQRYWLAATLALAGVTASIWGLVSTGRSGLAMIVGSVALPAAVMLSVADRLKVRLPLSAAVGGAIGGAVVALLSHAVVFAFAYLFFLGFAGAAVDLLGVLRIDPRFVAAAGSPWALLLFIEVVVVAPVTEELGKAVGASVFRPTDRRTAFLAGVAAGAGFAMVENILYASMGGFFGGAWEPIVVARMLGAAVHPLASGLVVLGWWEWRQSRDFGPLARRFFTGVGAHAIWNASLVVVAIAASAFQLSQLYEWALVSLAYSAGLGAVAAAWLWRLTVTLDDGDATAPILDSRDGRVVAAWTLMAASFLVPVAMLVLAYPSYLGGG
jgi:RsiW-degrading membrane proteinase PrsW (M82 family)